MNFFSLEDISLYSGKKIITHSLGTYMILLDYYIYVAR